MNSYFWHVFNQACCTWPYWNWCSSILLKLSTDGETVFYFFLTKLALIPDHLGTWVHVPLFFCWKSVQMVKWIFTSDMSRMDCYTWPFWNLNSCSAILLKLSTDGYIDFRFCHILNQGEACSITWPSRNLNSCSSILLKIGADD